MPRSSLCIHAISLLRHDFRKLHPLALKLFDVPHFTTGDRYFLFDSDLLFFNHPREILDWVARGADECWFNQDLREGSLITAAEARSELDIKIWSRVNSGLGLLAKNHAIDLDLCDRALAQTSILSGNVWRIEQTLHMLCAAHHGQGGLLPHLWLRRLDRETRRGHHLAPLHWPEAQPLPRRRRPAPEHHLATAGEGLD